MRVTRIGWDEAPQDGYVLACFRQEVMFQKYDPTLRHRIDERREDLLELHVFDRKKEYRLMRCETGEFIESVVCDEGVAEENRKVEKVKVESRFIGVMPYLQVINYIGYDENGMLSVSNYRFAPA